MPDTSDRLGGRPAHSPASEPQRCLPARLSVTLLVHADDRARGVLAHLAPPQQEAAWAPVRAYSLP